MHSPLIRLTTTTSHSHRTLLHKCCLFAASSTNLQQMSSSSFPFQPSRFIDKICPQRPPALTLMHRVKNYNKLMMIAALRPLHHYYGTSIRCFSSQSEDTEPGLEFFDGLYFDGEIPRNRISQKWSKASGPGGMHVNANPTKAEIRFQLAEADWIPPAVRERLGQKHARCMNSRGEFYFTSATTRSAMENMEDCFGRLEEMLKEVSLELVKERRRDYNYLSPECEEVLEERKERAEEFRMDWKRRRSDKKSGRRGGGFTSN